MSVILHAAALSDPGLIRANNEDASYAGRKVLVVADGIGGAPAGELASEIVMREFAGLEAAQTADPQRELRKALERASRAVAATADDDIANTGMGTTLTVLLLAADTVTLLHVGDSRAYLLRQGRLYQLTRDDTYVQELVDRGALAAQDVRHHPQRSIITKAVQGRPVEPQIITMTAEQADRFLLCSDGLSDFVTDESIEEALIGSASPQQCAEKLVKLTLQAGAPDNVTVVVADTAVEAKDR